MSLPHARDVDSLPDREAPRPFEAADPQSRAGGYTVEQLETLLMPVLRPDALTLSRQARWPLGYSFALVAGASALMWVAIISGISWLF